MVTTRNDRSSNLINIIMSQILKTHPTIVARYPRHCRTLHAFSREKIRFITIC